MTESGFEASRYPHDHTGYPKIPRLSSYNGKRRDPSTQDDPRVAETGRTNKLASCNGASWTRRPIFHAHER